MRPAGSCCLRQTPTRCKRPRGLSCSRISAAGSPARSSVTDVSVLSGPGGDQSQIVVQVTYLLIETQSQQVTEVTIPEMDLLVNGFV